MHTDEEVSAVTKILVSEGKLLEAGFSILQELMIPLNAPQAQIDDMRLAYMAGAQHLWASVMTSLDSGLDETVNDLVRMDKIQIELDTWKQSLELRFSSGVGGKQ